MSEYVPAGCSPVWCGSGNYLVCGVCSHSN